MSEISQVTNPLLAELAIKPANESKELDKNAFLELMVAQMNNQDPLSPQENGEFIAQLAQFSSVEGIDNLNNTVDSLATSMQSSQALQASALVGRTVHINTDQSHLTQDGVVTGSIKLDSSTNNLVVSISNPNGELVKQVELGNQSRGDVRFVWNGQDDNGNRLPPGNYSFRAEASTGGVTSQMEMALSANVDSVSIKPDQSVVLNLAAQGAVPLLSVEEIL